MIYLHSLMLVTLLLELGHNQVIYKISFKHTISPLDKVSWRNGSALVFGLKLKLAKGCRFEPCGHRFLLPQSLPLMVLGPRCHQVAGKHWRAYPSL